MKRKRHPPEDVIRKLREADAMRATGASVEQVCRTLGVSESTYSRWRAQRREMQEPDVKRLRELEMENARLKRIVGEQAIDLSILREVAKGNF